MCFARASVYVGHQRRRCPVLQTRNVHEALQIHHLIVRRTRVFLFSLSSDRWPLLLAVLGIAVLITDFLILPLLLHCHKAAIPSPVCASQQFVHET